MKNPIILRAIDFYTVSTLEKLICFSLKQVLIPMRHMGILVHGFSASFLFPCASCCLLGFLLLKNNAISLLVNSLRLLGDFPLQHPDNFPQSAF